MEKKKFNKALIKNIVIIFLWLFFLLVNEFVIVLQMFERVNETNQKDFILAIIIVFCIYMLGIALNICILIVDIKRKNSFKKNILSYIFQLLFVCAAFITMFESSLDAQATTVQVRKVLTFIQGNAFKIKLKSINVVLNTNKKKYEIGEEITYFVDFKPTNSNSKDLVYEVDNEIVSIDLVNNKIKCLANGECTITFYDATNKDVSSTVKLKIDSVLLEEIDLGPNKDILIDVNEEYQLEPILYPEAFKGEKLTFTSSNNEVATVDQHGNIKGLKPGSAIVTCKKDDVEAKVYVNVSPVRNIYFKYDKLLYISTTPTKTFSLYFDNIENFNSKYLKLNYKSENNIKISINNYTSATSNTVSGTITNLDTGSRVNETIEVECTYQYPGGYTLSASFTLEVTSGYSLEVDEIDTTKTKFSYEANLYYYKGALVTSFYEIPITYKSSTKLAEKDKFNSIAIINGDLDVSCTRYNKVIIGFTYAKEIKDFYTIKFYPSKLSNEYYEMALKINKIELTNLDSSFEMLRLYEESDGKLNEILPKYFNENLFEKVTFANPYFKNSGLKIIPVGDTLDYIDFEVSDYGVVKTLKLKDVTRYNTASECVLEFDICSLYEYHKDINCKKYRYVINIVNEHDDLMFGYQDIPLTGDDFEITVLKGENFVLSYKYLLDLEYKGTFQTSTYRDNAITAVIKNRSIISLNNAFNLHAKDYGVTTITYQYHKSLFKDLHPITITINVVDENGIIPIPKEISTTVLDFNEVCKPNLEKKNFSVGTTLKFDLADIFDYQYSSSNTDVIVVDSFGNAECVGAGQATITATNTQNPEESYVYTLTVYNFIPKVEIVKGDFFSVNFTNNYYHIVVKTNQSYNIELSEEVSEVRFYETNDYQNLILTEDGNVTVTKAGNYYGYVMVGEKGSPYAYKINFIIKCDDNGVDNDFLMLVRKSIGHFGLFMGISLLCMLSLVFYRPRKYFVVLINSVFVSGYIFFIAYATEFIQGLNPTRTNSFKDVMINFSGGMLGIILVILIFSIAIAITTIIKKLKLKKSSEDINK